MALALMYTLIYPLKIVFFPVDWIVIAGGIFAIAMIFLTLISIVFNRKKY